VALLPHVDQPVGAQSIEMASHRLGAQLERFRQLGHRKLAVTPNLT
jgi:hypothetical protein